MSTKYTEGPWYGKANEFQGLVISEATGATVAVVYDVKDTDLVAAAPELLNLCEYVLQALEGDRHSPLCYVFRRNDLISLIAKAKGLK